MPDETSEETPSSHGWAWWVGWGAFIVFMVYPLSVAPAIEIGHQLHWPYAYEAVFNVVYAPILWLCKICPPANSLYAWYLRAVGVY